GCILCRFRAAFTAQYCGANAYFTLFSWLPSYFADNFPHAKGVVFNVVPNLAIVTTAIIAPFIAAKLISKGYSITNTRKIMEGASLFGLAVCLLIVSWVTTFESALFLFTLGMACRGLHHGGVSVNPQDFAPNHTGAVFGVFNTASAVPGFVGVYVAGTILQWTKNWAYVFTFTALQCLLGVMVYSMFGTAKQLI
uniref:MFS transporter n=1 Tax=Plectus sambesii TaxID=2011161 RepID=A0A914UQR5_9BILA